MGVMEVGRKSNGVFKKWNIKKVEVEEKVN